MRNRTPPEAESATARFSRHGPARAALPSRRLETRGTPARRMRLAASGPQTGIDDPRRSRPATRLSLRGSSPLSSTLTQVVVLLRCASAGLYFRSLIGDAAERDEELGDLELRPPSNRVHIVCVRPSGPPAPAQRRRSTDAQQRVRHGADFCDLPWLSHASMTSRRRWSARWAHSIRGRSVTIG
jgi:hypothetical protein